MEIGGGDDARDLRSTVARQKREPAAGAIFRTSPVNNNFAGPNRWTLLAMGKPFGLADTSYGADARYHRRCLGNSSSTGNRRPSQVSFHPRIPILVAWAALAEGSLEKTGSAVGRDSDFDHLHIPEASILKAENIWSYLQPVAMAVVQGVAMCKVGFVERTEATVRGSGLEQVQAALDLDGERYLVDSFCAVDCGGRWRGRRDGEELKARASRGFEG
jgi:hypothetical protein